jgi:hypothetical protein
MDVDFGDLFDDGGPALFVPIVKINRPKDIVQHLPDVMPRYGKIRRKGGDNIRGSISMRSSQRKVRDSSYIRVSFASSAHTLLLILTSL